MKSTGLLILDCVYKLFEAFVLWRKANDDYFLARKAKREAEELAADEAERVAREAEAAKDIA